MRIMIVDDSKDAVFLLRTLLRTAGCPDVVEASSGAEALDTLRAIQADPAAPNVDLALMDILMPDLDGIETTRRIKDDPELRDVLVVMVTAMNDLGSLEEAFEAGAMDYLQKPVNPVELRARVRSALRLKEEMDLRKARERDLAEVNARLESLLGFDGLADGP